MRYRVTRIDWCANPLDCSLGEPHQVVTDLGLMTRDEIKTMLSRWPTGTTQLIQRMDWGFPEGATEPTMCTWGNNHSIVVANREVEF